MKIVMTNVTTGNVKQVKALMLVATNLVPTATKYVPDSDAARYIHGYREVCEAYWEMPYNERENFVPAANPFEASTKEAHGYRNAVSDLSADCLHYKCQIVRWRLEAAGDSPADINLLLRFAHTLGKTYRNIDVTIQD